MFSGHDQVFKYLSNKGRLGPGFSSWWFKYQEVTVGLGSSLSLTVFVFCGCFTCVQSSLGPYPPFWMQTTPVTMQVGEGQQVQIVQAQPQGQTQQAQSGTGQTMQVMQQIITNTGEIQQIPVRLCRWKRGTVLWANCPLVFWHETLYVRFFNCKRKFGLSGVFPALREEN